jgi:hypothetical protein
MTLPQPDSAGGCGPHSRLQSPTEIAVERFGPTEGLLLVDGTKLGLARHYAEKHGLDLDDPDVLATTTLKAWVRFREFALIESGAQTRAMAEIRKLHEQAKGLDRDLVQLKKSTQV